MNKSADLIKSIAVELSILEGEVWTAEITGYYSDRLHGEKGEKLYIEISQGRVHTSAGQPEGCTRNVSSPDKISANEQRSPEAIAQDIARRLIPQARDYWQKCRDEQARHDQKVKAITESCERLEGYGMKRNTWHNNPDDERATLYAENMKAEIYSDNEIYNFEISHITIDQAIQIIQILKGESSNGRR
jgi:hypothetical protein